MAPPQDDNHGCAFRDYAKYLEDKLKELEAKVTVLHAALEHRREKRGKKMPMVPPLPAFPDQAAKKRLERANLRAQQVETTQENLAVPEEMKRCTDCTGPFRRVGDGKPCEIYSYVPAHLRRRVVTRETLACACGSTVVTAPAPFRWAENARYDASFAAYAITNKCLSSTPHHRFEKELHRSGVPIARSTINEIFRRAARKVSPLETVLFGAIREDFAVHVDETTFKLTTKESKAYMWAFVGERLTGYRFDKTRSGDVPIHALGDSCGVIICDDYRGYDPIARKSKRKRCGCLAHARRKFFEAGNVPEAEDAMRLIGAIYGVEREAARRGVMGTEAHLELRRTYARPLFIELLKLAKCIRRDHGPKTLLGRAASYTWRNMNELRRFLGDARIRPDNNIAEGALRLVALGRKNFLFVHSEEAGKELATLFSLVVSCDRNGVNPVAYLTDVLNRIDITNPEDYRDLLPDRWTPPSREAAPMILED